MKITGHTETQTHQKYTLQDTRSKTQSPTKSFGQLAEMRNSIRHSRALSEITVTEGEAALLWLGQILSDKTNTAP